MSDGRPEHVQNAKEKDVSVSRLVDIERRRACNVLRTFSSATDVDVRRVLVVELQREHGVIWTSLDDYTTILLRSNTKCLLGQTDTEDFSVS